MADGKPWNLSNHAVYSDDGGRTWNVSDVVSEDGGLTWSGTRFWDNLCVFNCNGDIIRHDNILMLSTPANGTWRDVGIFLSFDEGETWPVHKVLSPGASMYSSITVLKDNTIGIYYEANTSSNEL